MTKEEDTDGDLMPLQEQKIATHGKSIAVVGGGILGMYLAWKLRDRGAKVTIYERGPATGGLASSMGIGSFVWDRFYHVTLLSDKNLIDMLSQLGLESKLQWRITKTGFYTDGALYSMSNSIEFLKFPPLSLLDKLRLGGTISLHVTCQLPLLTDWPCKSATMARAHGNDSQLRDRPV